MEAPELPAPFMNHDVHSALQLASSAKETNISDAHPPSLDSLALVEVQEQTAPEHLRGDRVRVGRAEGVGGAGAQLPLIVYRRHPVPQIDHARQQRRPAVALELIVLDLGHVPVVHLAEVDGDPAAKDPRGRGGKGGGVRRRRSLRGSSRLPSSGGMLKVSGVMASS